MSVSQRGPCAGKVQYPSNAAAIRVIVRRARETCGLRSYYCHDCRAWHLTSQKRRGSVVPSRP